MLPDIRALTVLVYVLFFGLVICMMMMKHVAKIHSTDLCANLHLLSPSPLFFYFARLSVRRPFPQKSSSAKNDETYAMILCKIRKHKTTR